MTVAPAPSADAAAVVALWAACGLTRPWNDPDTDFARALAGATSTVLVARRDGAVTGSVMVGYDGHRGWVYYLAVDPVARREGLGRALMAAAEAWLHAHGAPKIQLMVRDANTSAGAFYEALGFTRQPVTTWGRFIDEGAA